MREDLWSNNGNVIDDEVSRRSAKIRKQKWMAKVKQEQLDELERRASKIFNSQKKCKKGEFSKPGVERNRNQTKRRNLQPVNTKRNSTIARRLEQAQFGLQNTYTAESW